MSKKIRVFVGCTESEEIPFQVLKKSIEDRSSQPVEVIPLYKYTERLPATLRGPIPFSFQRFLIPQICQYRGHAIYMDSDMLCLGDINELWQMRGADICAPGVDQAERLVKFSVMVIDCSRVKWQIKQIAENFESNNRGMGPGSYYSELMHKQPWPGQIVCGNAPEWNHLEIYEPETKLIHYTVFTTQPWKIQREDGAADLWYREFRAWHKSDPIHLRLIEEHKQKGFINARLF